MFKLTKHMMTELELTMKAYKKNCTDQDYAQVIISGVSNALQVSIDDLKSKCREKELIDARYIIFYILCGNTKLSLRRIGEYLNRDHSTVLYGCGVYEDMIHSKNKKFLEKLDWIKQEFASQCI